MRKPKREQIIAYVNPATHNRITTHAKRTGMSVSRVVERVLESGSYPDNSIDRAVLQLLDINADQARLGNLLLKGINETANGQIVHQMRQLLDEIRLTQTHLKTRVLELKP